MASAPGIVKRGAECDNGVAKMGLTVPVASPKALPVRAEARWMGRFDFENKIFFK